MARQTTNKGDNKMKNETYLGLNIPTIRKITEEATEEEIIKWSAKLREAGDQDTYQQIKKTISKNFLRGDRKEIVRRSR
jgi:hypothetical protein